MRVFLTFLFTIGFLSVIAQPGCPPPFGDDKNAFSPFHITIGTGITHLNGTLKDNDKLGHVLLGKVDYQFLKGLYIGVEGQIGALRAQSQDTIRAVRNNYLAAGMNLTIHPFEILMSEQFSNEKIQRGFNAFYVGTGMRAIRNKYDMDESYNLDVANYNEANGTWILPSLNIGFALPISTVKWNKTGYLSAIINAQFNYGSNENLDGFHARQLVTNEDGTVSNRLVDGHKDRYNAYYIGLRYSF